jgi:hypothetical protein
VQQSYKILRALLKSIYNNFFEHEAKWNIVKIKYNDKSEQRYVIYLHITILYFDRSEIAPWEYENLSKYFISFAWER